MTLLETQINCIPKLLVQYFRLLWTIIELVQFSECNAQFLNFLMQFIKISSSQCTYYLEWVRALYWCMEPADWLMHRFTANLAARLEEALGSAESYPWFANFNASSTLSNNISLSPDPKQCQFSLNRLHCDKTKFSLDPPSIHPTHHTDRQPVHKCWLIMQFFYSFPHLEKEKQTDHKATL